MSFDRKNLGSLLREPLRNGKSARASKSGEGVPVFTLTAVTNADFSVENTKNSVMTEKQAEDVWAEPGDIFIERSNTPELVGTAALYNGPRRFAVFPDLLIRVRPVEDLNGRFLAYFLKSEEARRYFRREARGIAGSMPKISQGTVEGLAVPVPVLPVQKAIVAAIETHFSRLDAAVASLTRAKTNVQRARASVLKAAVEGRLVPTEASLARVEGRDYEPASALLARILTEREAAHEAAQEGAKRRRKYKPPVEPETEGLPELPEGWCWTSMDALAQVVGGITKDRKLTAGREVPYLRVANVQRGYLDLSLVKEIFAKEEKIEKLRLQVGDILLNEGGDRDKLGRGWVWRGELPECIHQNHVFRARLWKPDFDSRYLSHYANTQGHEYFIRQGKQTTNLASISLTKVRALPVALPPQTEIRRILEEVDRRLSVLDAIDTTLDANLARCECLRQSILKRAFEGRLVDAAVPTSQLDLFPRQQRTL